MLNVLLGVIALGAIIGYVAFVHLRPHGKNPEEAELKRHSHITDNGTHIAVHRSSANNVEHAAGAHKKFGTTPDPARQ